MYIPLHEPGLQRNRTHRTHILIASRDIQLAYTVGAGQSNNSHLHAGDSDNTVLSLRNWVPLRPNPVLKAWKLPAELLVLSLPWRDKGAELWHQQTLVTGMSMFTQSCRVLPGCLSLAFFHFVLPMGWCLSYFWSSSSSTSSHYSTSVFLKTHSQTHWGTCYLF